MDRTEREKELNRLAETREGCKDIRQLWNKVKGIPLGSGVIGTLVRGEMIPEILKHEFPNG